VPISEKTQALLYDLKTRAEGLTHEEVLNRKSFKKKKTSEVLTALKILFRNFYSPLVLLLLVTALFSVYLHDELNAYIVFSIIIISSLISFFQEWKAHRDTKHLIDAMKMSHTVLRNNEKMFLDSENLVEGDILIIDAGDLIPLNCELIESRDIFVNESSITGESLPKEKHVLEDPLLKIGSYIVSGMGKAVILKQDKQNNFDELLSYISRGTNTSSFTKSLFVFSKFLMNITLLFTGIVLIILVIFKTEPLQAFLFALSIAVGISPQLLPAILTTNLALGARKMSKVGALTKRLESIETLGNMDLLCCDKTGTLTKGKIEMYAALDAEGIKSEDVRRFSYINALLQTGFKNTLDQAIIEANHFDHSLFEKLDEIPYDFNRKILSIYTKIDHQNLLIAKGALENILDRCTISKEEKQNILERAKTYYTQGFRLLGLATKIMSAKLVSKTDEINMDFQGFLLFFDPIKEDCPQMLNHLKDLGIRLVMITGDHPVIATFVAKKAGFLRTEAFEGGNLAHLLPEQIQQTLSSYDVFARVEPLDKAKLIEEFKKLGYTVGFLGDGINDSGALYISDVGISVETGSDVAKATSDLILVKKQLSAIVDAVKEGRKIFSNTLKYILMAVSANFGNMFSMAGVALFIPFLPLLPTQILLINFLQDIPEMSISLDNVDNTIIRKPQKWNIQFIKKFMLVFGPISSIFDFAIFFTMKYFAATPQLFRSAWFTESVISAVFIILFIRTRFLFYKSKPSWILTLFVFSTIIFTLLIPYTPLGPIFDIIVLPKSYYGAIFIIVALYAILVELAKRTFYKWTLKTSMISS
jgi:Mg2+-importing ATPase